MIYKVIGAFVCLFMVFVDPCLAQKRKSAKIVKKNKANSAKRPKTNSKKVLVSFDEDLVEGNMTGAELFLILQKKQTRFQSLFKLRTNFKDKMYENAEGID